MELSKFVFATVLEGMSQQAMSRCDSSHNFVLNQFETISSRRWDQLCKFELLRQDVNSIISFGGELATVLLLLLSFELS